MIVKINEHPIYNNTYLADCVVAYILSLVSIDFELYVRSELS